MSIDSMKKPLLFGAGGALVALVILLVLQKSPAVSRDFFSIKSVIEPASGDFLFLGGYLLMSSKTKTQPAWARLNLKYGRLEREEKRPWKMHGVRLAKKNYTFRIEKDSLFIGPVGGVPVRHYILDLAAKAFPKAGLPVSRYHGKRGHFMRIQGQYPGGVVVREPRRFHRGGGFSDGYFIVSPEGSVGAEIALPANGSVVNHRVVHLTRKGVLVAAVKKKDGGSLLRGINCRTGEVLFEVE